MAATGTPTPNIGLRCPQGTDPASVDDINYNSGVIDTKMGAVGDTSLQAQITALNSKMATSVENHSDWLTSAEAGDSGTMLYVQKMGKLLILNLRTTGRVHTDADTLANLPTGYRPINTIDVPCWINGSGVGVCRIQTDGVVRTWAIPSGSASSGRVYLYAAYLIA